MAACAHPASMDSGKGDHRMKNSGLAEASLEDETFPKVGVKDARKLGGCFRPKEVQGHLLLKAHTWHEGWGVDFYQSPGLP
jgi:hypothetical protein